MWRIEAAHRRRVRRALPSRWRTVSALLLWCCVFGGGAWGAEVYKWVDEAGRVHYGDARPADGVAETIETQSAPPELEVLRSRSRLDEILQQERVTKGQRAKQQQEVAAAAARDQRRQARCRHARRQLHVLELERPIYHVDDDGKRVYLADDQRAAELARARKAVGDACR